MSEKSLRFCSWWNRDWLSRYVKIALGVVELVRARYMDFIHYKN